MCLKVIWTGMVTILCPSAVCPDRTASLSNRAACEPSVLIAGNPRLHDAKGTLPGAAVERRIRGTSAKSCRAGDPMPGRPDLAAACAIRRPIRTAVVTPVRCVETHISWVLLTGPYAYKIKKPVRLSFLDYSTPRDAPSLLRGGAAPQSPAMRPDLYLDVSTIGGPATAPRIDGGGEPIEYAVRMQQFDPQRRTDALLATRGVVGAAELAALGEHVARFHARPHRSPPRARSERRARCAQITLDNFAEPARPPGGRAVAAALCGHSSNGSTRSRASRDADQREARSGLVRECHGDLHCGNVVRWRGRARRRSTASSSIRRCASSTSPTTSRS